MNFDSDTMWNKDGTTGEFTGVKGGSGTTKAFFAGATDKDGTDAKFFAQADGNIFHASIGTLIYSPSSIAGFSSGDTASALGNDSWKRITQANGAQGEQSSQGEKIITPYRKRFGTDMLRLSGLSRGVYSVTGGSPGINTRQVQLRVEIGSIDETITIESGDNFQSFSKTVDISSLTDDTNYLLTVSLVCKLELNGTISDSAQLTAELRDDFYVLATTEMP